MQRRTLERVEMWIGKATLEQVTVSVQKKLPKLYGDAPFGRDRLQPRDVFVSIVKFVQRIDYIRDALQEVDKRVRY